MLSLQKGYGRSAQVGQPLPTVYKNFEANKVTFRRSATSMLAAAAGQFKSCLALNLLVGWAQAGAYGLYFSADADEFTTAKRAAAILTGRTVEDAETGLRSGTGPFHDSLSAMDNTRWIYKPATIDEVDRELRGFESVYGSFPHVVVIDNLMNMDDAADGDHNNMRMFIRDIDIMAREAECHVLVLHHTSEGNWAAGQPPPRSAVMGKIAQFPRLMLTVGVNEETMNVAVVKNTNGPQDPSGATFFPMCLDAEKMTVKDSGAYLNDREAIF